MINMIQILVLIIGVNALSTAQAQKASTNSPSYFLIATIPIKTKDQKSCQLTVLSSIDKSEIKIIRLDPPAGKINADYFLNNSSQFAAYGDTIKLSQEFDLVGKEIKRVQSFTDFDDKKKEIRIELFVDERHPMIKTYSVEEFFSGGLSQCLK